MYDFLFRFVCNSLHMAEFYVSLWLLLQLSNWEHIVSAVTGSWAALFAKGKAGYIQSSFRSPRFCSSSGNVKWLLRKVQCLFTSAPATEVFAHSWSEAFTLGQCGRVYTPRHFTIVHVFTGHACSTCVRVGLGFKWAHCFAGCVYLIMCCILLGVSLAAWSIKQLPFRKRKKHFREWTENVIKH